MGAGRSQTGGPTASVGSLIDLIASLDSELGHLLVGGPSAASVVGSAASRSGKVAGGLLVSVLGLLESSGFAGSFHQALAGTRPSEPDREENAMAQELAGLRERERSLTEDVAALAEKAEHFEEVMRELAQTQGRCLAKLEAAGEFETVRSRLDAFERDFDDFKAVQKNSTHGALEGFEGVRTRLSKLEARGSDMAREARARSGRLDALSAHVVSVERKLDAALGARPVGEAVRMPAATTDVDKTVQATR